MTSESYQSAHAICYNRSLKQYACALRSQRTEIWFAIPHCVNLRRNHLISKIMCTGVKLFRIIQPHAGLPFAEAQRRGQRDTYPSLRDDKTRIKIMINSDPMVTIIVEDSAGLKSVDWVNIIYLNKILLLNSHL
jgi:hypothetical protein